MAQLQNIQYMDGYDHGALLNSLYGNKSNASIISGAARTGGYGLRLSCTSSRAYLTIPHTAVGPTARLYIRFNTLPNSDAYIFHEGQTSGFQRFVGIQYHSATGALRGFGLDRLNNEFYTSDGFVPTTGVWYRFDVKISNTTIDWYVDGNAQPSGNFSGMDASSGSLGVWLMGNNYGATTTMSMDIDDVLVIEDVGARTPNFPIGPGQVLTLNLNGDGTHNNAGAFKDSGGNSPPASPSYTKLDDSPLSDSGTDYIYQETADSSAYMEHTFTSLPGWMSNSFGSVHGYNAYLSYIWLEGGWYVIVPVGGKLLVGSTTITYIANQVVDTNLSWQSLGSGTATQPTISELNAMKVRYGFSDNMGGGGGHVRRDMIFAQVAIAPDTPTSVPVTTNIDALLGDALALSSSNLYVPAIFERIDWRA